MNDQTGASQTWRANLTSVTRKVFVTGLIAAPSYLLTDWILDDDGPWPIAASVFLGGVAFVTQFLISMEKRVDDLDDRILANFKDINQATELHEIIERSKVPTSKMYELVRAAVEAEQEAPELVMNLAHSEIRRLLSFLRDVQSLKRAEYVGEDRDWLLGLARHVQTSIKAVSLSTVDYVGGRLTDGGLWQTDLGMRYLDLQQEAAHRTDRHQPGNDQAAATNVAIQRVFVIDMRDVDIDGPFKEVLRKHCHAGVEVRLVTTDTLSAHGISANAQEDFIIFDDVLAYETVAAPRPNPEAAPKIVTTRINLHNSIITARLHQFEELWRCATPWKPEPEPEDGEAKPSPE